VGSAFVNIVSKHQNDVERMLEELKALARKLKEAAKRRT